jgi:hypothetical protein
VTDPCTLDEALTRAQAGDVISLAKPATQAEYPTMTM